MFSDILRRERQAAGLTQEQLAHAAGVDRTYISMLENDKGSPTLEMLFKLCKALKISAAKLVSEIESSSQ